MKRIHLNESQLYRLIERVLNEIDGSQSLESSLCEAYEQIAKVLSGLYEISRRGKVRTINVDKTNIMKAKSLLKKLCAEEGIDVTNLSSSEQSFEDLDDDSLFVAISEGLNSTWSALNDAVQNPEGYDDESESKLVSGLYEVLHIVEYVGQKWCYMTL